MTTMGTSQATQPPENFAAAHRRHWQDAEILFGLNRFGNADHLYGFSGECGLKAVMTGHGQMKRRHRVHLPSLWSEFVAFIEGHGRHRLLQFLPDEAPFADWRVDARYTDSGYTGEESVRLHRNAARQIRTMVQAVENSL